MGPLFVVTQVGQFLNFPPNDYEGPTVLTHTVCKGFFTNRNACPGVYSIFKKKLHKAILHKDIVFRFIIEYIP